MTDDYMNMIGKIPEDELNNSSEENISFVENSISFYKRSREYKLGERFLVNGIECECVEKNNNCTDCVFWNKFNGCKQRYPLCIPGRRKDNRFVKFIKID